MARAKAARLPARMPSIKLRASSGRGDDGSRGRTERPADGCVGVFIEGLLSEPSVNVIRIYEGEPAHSLSATQPRRWSGRGEATGSTVISLRSRETKKSVHATQSDELHIIGLFLLIKGRARLAELLSELSIPRLRLYPGAPAPRPTRPPQADTERVGLFSWLT